jgi:hypothetical protein
MIEMKDVDYSCSDCSYRVGNFVVFLFWFNDCSWMLDISSGLNLKLKPCMGMILTNSNVTSMFRVYTSPSTPKIILIF